MVQDEAERNYGTRWTHGKELWVKKKGSWKGK